MLLTCVACSGALWMRSAAAQSVYRHIAPDGSIYYTLERERSPRAPAVRSRPPALRPEPTRRPPSAAPAEKAPQVAARGAPEPTPPSSRSELEARLARERGLLKDLISRRGLKGSELAGDPKLRELAETLPRLERQLEEASEE